MPTRSFEKVSTEAGSGMVSSRRLRKRELDRNAQRNARERTKTRIAYLERLVEDLQHENAGGPVARLMEQLSEVTQELDDLSKTLRAVKNLLETKPHDGGIDRVFRLPKCPGSATKARLSPYALDSAADVTMTSVSPKDLRNPESFEDVIIPQNPECDCSAVSATSFPPKELNRWRFANEVLQGKPRLPVNILDLEDATAEDTPVRAMIEGWEAVEASGRMPPLWQKLRRIDEVIFSTCSKVERLAIMRLMHLLYRYHAGSTETRKADLPTWYLSRPSQESIAHSYAINFFAWPGLRERFIFSQHRYCSNTFWRLFAKNAVMLWPYEFRDCYTYNVETSQYAMSAAFEKNIRDINCWTMKSDMYERWPEFRSDIPAYCEVPMTLPDPRGQQSEHEQGAQTISYEPCDYNWAESQALTPWPPDLLVDNHHDGVAFNALNFFTIPTDDSATAFQRQRSSRMIG